MTQNKEKARGLTDKEASKISEDTYERNLTEVEVEVGGETIIHNVIETIENTDTGLHGYVLQNEKTRDITISFEGTQRNRGAAQFSEDMKENIFGIISSHDQYAVEVQEEEYTGSDRQEAILKEDPTVTVEEGVFSRQNINQFTAASKIVKKYVEAYGPEKVTLTGHSLAGAIAQVLAIRHDTDAVTFAAASIKDLLSEEELEKIEQGYYQDQIVSYVYPNDVVSSYKKIEAGTIYYLENPRNTEEDLIKRGSVVDYIAGTIQNHGIKNYTDEDSFNELGYYRGNLIYDPDLKGVLTMSPLAAKNRSQGGDYQILIQADLMRSYAKRAEEGVDRIEDTEKMLRNFWEIYFEEMQGLRQSYDAQVGHGQYDLLDASDVTEIFSSTGVPHQGTHIPMLFKLHDYQELIHETNLLYQDTVEMVSHMHLVSDEFEKRDLSLGESIKKFLFSRWT